MSYLKSFVIGSSFPTFILFLIAVDYEKKKTFSYNFYSKYVPFAFGMANVASRFLAKQLNLTLEQRFFYTTIIGIVYRLISSRKFGFYDYNKNEWCKYNVVILFLYTFTFMVVMYNLERLL